MCDDDLGTEDLTQEEFDNAMRVLLGGKPVDEETDACNEDDKEEN